LPKKSTYQPREVLAEYVRRFGDLEELNPAPQTSERAFKFKNDLFKEQKDFIDDPSQFKAALCSRRAGKTYSACFYLIEVASTHPECLCAYLALTRNSAKRLMWSELKRANRKYMLGMRFNNTELICTLPNESKIMLTGANDSEAVEALRGSPYRLVIIDECASFGKNISVVVDEIITPSLVDHHGTLAVIGTPSASCTGHFFDATTNPEFGYSVHKWTIRDNPHIPHAVEWLEQRKKQRKWDDNHPAYLREWCGKWVKSRDALVYKYTNNNLISHVPEEDLEYIIGVDLGWADATAIIIGGFSERTNKFYITDCHKESKMLPAEISEMLKEIIEIYEPTSVVCDTGGLGKSIVEEMRARYGLPIKAAEKKNKASYIEIMNSDLNANCVMVMQGLPLLEEWDILQWDDSFRKEDKRFDNHLSDAALYAYRESRHYIDTNDSDSPEKGSKRYYAQLEEQVIQSIEQKIYDEENKPWWEESSWMN